MEVVAIRLDEPVKSARFNPLDRAIAALGTEGVAMPWPELRESYRQPSCPTPSPPARGSSRTPAATC